MSIAQTGTDVGTWRRQRAWELHQAGWWQKDIAVALGVTRGAVSQWIKRGREGGMEALPACLAGQTRPARRLPGTTARKSADAQRTGTWARIQASARWAVGRAANRCCNIWWSMMMILPRGWSRA